MNSGGLAALALRNIWNRLGLAFIMGRARKVLRSERLEYLAQTHIETHVQAGDAARAGEPLENFLPPGLVPDGPFDEQKLIPTLAHQRRACALIGNAVRNIPTKHRFILGDSRRMGFLDDESVHLVVTSPPYWTLKRYEEVSGQLGHLQDYESFLSELDEVWRHAYRTLVPGGRMVVVVGDVCLSRRVHGRHVVYPLHASIQEHCRKVGFDNLAPIIWHKIANAKYEVDNGSGFLGKPYEPNAVVKNDIEFILFQRKPGGYRKPSLAARVLSLIPGEQHKSWFRQIWTDTGASTRDHPAPFPLSIAERLIRMFSFVGDTVLDPFMGTGTTNLAASLVGRNSIGIEVAEKYFHLAERKFRAGQGVQPALAL
jgi:DNA modification methylase